MIGKRKREAVVVDRRQPTARHSADDGANEVLRQHFESVFEPLPDLKQHDEDVVADSGDSEDADASHSDWDGLSDDDAQPITTVEVVEHSKRDESETTGRRSTEFKAFMTSKPPKEARAAVVPKGDPESEDESETLNLKHDLDLQRLLKESHLFGNGKATESTGTQRHRATDLRMQQLGSRKSLFDQNSMPMSHRQGMSAKATAKDTLRRKNAAESGIVLEKWKARSSKPSSGRRDRGVDAPAMGKFQGGTLKLSRRDIAGMQGPRQQSRKRGKR